MLALESPMLRDAGFRHGFFAAASEDEAARALGIDALYFARQVHGPDLVFLLGDDRREVIADTPCDGLAARAADHGCAVRVADCVPVLLAAGNGAVAAIHSGWRGTVQSIVPRGVALIRDLAEGSELTAAVGPCIGACCFEIGPEVAVEIAAASPLGEAAIDRSRARPHADLRAVVAAQLAEAGVRQVDHVAGCTKCDARGFPSYRRDGKGGGRILAGIVTRSP
jgi:polyphenol oxidase